MTIAQALEAKGEARGEAKGRTEGQRQALRDTLLRQMQKRFDKVPKKTVAAVERCDDVAQLNRWLDRIVEVESLKDMGITP